MGGMSSGPSDNNSVIVSAFHSALAHQGLIVIGIIAMVLVVANVARAMSLRAALAAGPQLVEPTGAAAPLEPAEPIARRVLRLGFGAFWVLDGLLQAQPSMPVGMVPQVIQPASAGSPTWVLHLVNAGTSIWDKHPVPASAATVWIQCGLGLWLIVAARGRWSRLGGAATAAWGLLVWAFGEAFGGIFAPGLSWFFGAPGAALVYAIAGVFIALPERHLASARFGRILLAVIGAFMTGMAILQAWPGRGTWHGAAIGGMVASMVSTPQPGSLASLLRNFSSFAVSHGDLVNAVAIVALGAIGIVLMTGIRRLAFPAVVAASVLCVATWVLVQDLGFLGGVGTDPNSMLPTLLLIVVGYLALTRGATDDAVVPAVAPHRESQPAPVTAPGRLALSFGAIAAGGAAAIVMVGAVPMAFASLNSTADPIVSEAVDGTPNATNAPAPAFSLVDQSGKAVSLASLHDKVVALTFLDPVCSSDCPLIAQEFKQTDKSLGTSASGVEFVSIVSNPLYRSIAAVQAFDRAEGMSSLKNWLFLTGSVEQLKKSWAEYGIQVQVQPAGSMVAHSDLVYLIDQGRTRYILDSDPGAGTSASKSSFSSVLQTSIDHLLT